MRDPAAIAVWETTNAGTAAATATTATNATTTTAAGFVSRTSLANDHLSLHFSKHDVNECRLF